MDRSSKMVLDEAKMPRRTAGVTGILLEDWPGGCWLGLSAPKVEGVTVLLEENERLEFEDMMAVVGCRPGRARDLGSEGRGRTGLRGPNQDQTTLRTRCKR